MMPTQYEPAYLQWADGNVGRIFTFDAVTTETHMLVSQLASHPVESGVNIVDNVNQQSDELMLEGIVTETPLSAIRSVQGAKSYPLVLKSLALDLPKGKSYEQVSVPIQWPAASVSSILSSGLFAAPLTAFQAAFRPSKYNALIQDVDRSQSRQVLTLQATEDFDPVQDAFDSIRAAKEAAILITAHTPKHTYTNMIVTSVSMTRTPENGMAAMFSITLVNVRIVSSKIVKAPVPTEKRAVASVSKGNQPPVEPVDKGSSVWKGLDRVAAGQVLTNLLKP
jgi:hypothetical protein